MFYSNLFMVILILILNSIILSVELIKKFDLQSILDSITAVSKNIDVTIFEIGNEKILFVDSINKNNNDQSDHVEEKKNYKNKSNSIFKLINKFLSAIKISYKIEL